MENCIMKSIYRYLISERALETCDLNYVSSAPPIGNRHLSKSTSELSSPREMPEIRPRSAAPPEISNVTVYQKAHSFFAQLKVGSTLSFQIYVNWCFESLICSTHVLRYSIRSKRGVRHAKNMGADIFTSVRCSLNRECELCEAGQWLMKIFPFLRNMTITIDFSIYNFIFYVKQY